MPFGNNGYHSNPDTPLENLVRTAEAEAAIRDIITRFMGTDHFSRDPDIRRSGLQNAASLGDRYTMEDAVRMDDIRRYGAVSSLLRNYIVTVVFDMSLD
jgi:hypothetical protein